MDYERANQLLTRLSFNNDFKEFIEIYTKDYPLSLLPLLQGEVENTVLLKLKAINEFKLFIEINTNSTNFENIDE